MAGITERDEYPATSHLSEALLFKGYGVKPDEFDALVELEDRTEAIHATPEYLDWAAAQRARRMRVAR